MSVFCTNCGSPMDDDARFCPSCGAKMLPESAVPKTPEQKPAQGGNPAGVMNNGNVSGGNTGFGSSGQSGSGTYTGPSGANRPNGQGSYPGPGQSAQGTGDYSRPGQNSGAYPGPGGYQRPQGGSYGGGAMPPRKSGGVPKILFVIAGVVMIAAIAGGVFLFRGLSKGKEEVETTEEIIETEVETKVETRAEKETPEETEAVKATGDLSKIKIPDGAVVKKDAVLWDLVGEYKGEIQLTKMDGYEDMDGIPDDFSAELKRILKEPIDCELEIDEYGQWEISWPMMSGSMDFDSDDYDDPEEFTQEEIDGLMIGMPKDGVYHAHLDKEGDLGDGTNGRMVLDHIGAYCTDGDDSLIAGNFFVKADMYGMDVTIEGDFVVHKTSEEFTKEDIDPADKKESDRDKDIKESGDKGDTDFKERFDSDALGKKADELDKKQEKEKETEAETKVEIPTVSGGKWKQVGSEWMYEKDKKLVKNSWILHKNVYYYVDENGFMLTEAYTPDGYYVGKDGSWDKNDPRNKKSGGNSDTSDMSDAELREIAEDLSTTDYAKALEFDWFYDYVLNKGRENGRVITDKRLARRITDEQAALNGGWKAFMFTKDGDYGSDGERYLNATVDTKGGKFNITLNWKYFIDPTTGKTVTEKGNTLFRGTYDDLEGTAVCRSDDAMIEFDAFYISTDGLTEYAIGTYHWISGEIDQIALVRGVV
ncbi:hypothetical protein UYO_0234 [Lachnospiraceae bacterium JC7]|nr:hypothetical protein UYO_0234 [Lachnospiraceae bacterium JC7]